MTHCLTRLRIVAFLALAGATVGPLACTEQARAPESCAAAADRAANDPRLGIQGGSDDAVNSREIAKVHIYLARTAAASGNEAECRRQLSWVYLR